MEHYKKLENMYLAAPKNDFYKPYIKIEEGKAEIGIEVENKFFHTAGAVHGSVYFNLLDDAAFFAANSLVEECFVLTTSFTTYITKPVVNGKMIAKGEVKSRTGKTFLAESVVYDEKGNEVARGNGLFATSKILLSGIKEYQ